MNTVTTQKLLEEIARKHLCIDTLVEQRSDRLDFHEVSVWGVEKALKAAFEAGLKAGQNAKEGGSK